MRRVFIAVTAMLLACHQSMAGINNPGSASGAGGGSGSAQVNLGGIDIGNGGTGGAFINFMKTFAPSAVAPAQFDNLQYPIGNGVSGAGSLSANYGTGWKIPPALQASGVTWIYTWPATRTFSQVINVPVNVTASTNCTCNPASGAGSTLTIRSQGTAGSVTFNFTTGSPPPSVSGYFEAGAHYNSASQSGDIVLMRVSDQAAYNAGAIFTPEFIATLSGLNPKTIRPMGWIFPGSADYTNEVNWNYRTVPTQLSYLGFQLRNSTFGGTVTGTDAYTIPAAPDTPLSGWVAGEVVQGQVTNAATKITISGAVAADGTHCASATAGLVCLTVNASATLATNQSVWINGVTGTTEANGVKTITVVDATHVAIQGVTFVHAYAGGGFLGSQTLTVTGKTGGAKFISDAAGYPLWTQGNNDGLNAADFATFIYDNVLDRVIGVPFGIVNTVPIEVQVALANKLNSNLWITIPSMANDTYVTNMVASPLSNLSTKLYLEYGNEIWNNGFPLTQWSYNRGLAIGWPDSSNEPLHGWYGLRYRQIMGNVTTQWSATRSLSDLKRVIGSKAFDTPSQVGPQRLQGTFLNNASAANYTSFGYLPYNSAPNRPVDFADIFSYATYYSGSALTNGGFYSTGSTAPQITTLQSIATNYAAGGSGITTALASIDADIRCAGGTCTGPNETQTLYGLSTNGFGAAGVYGTWVTMLGTYGTGQTVENYEGALETLAPDETNLGQCTTMGITVGGSAATACTAIQNALAAYKNGSQGSQIVFDQFTQARAAGIVTPSWLSISGPSQWSFYPSDIFDSSAYQTYAGFASFH